MFRTLSGHLGDSQQTTRCRNRLFGVTKSSEPNVRLRDRFVFVSFGATLLFMTILGHMILFGAVRKQTPSIFLEFGA
jgi:hypothetical protein